MTIPPLSSSEDESALIRQSSDLVTGLREAFRARDALYPHHDYDLETVDGLGVTAFGDIRELVEALATTPSDPSTAWRGIESAPRDGTVVLVWYAPTMRSGPITAAFWCDEEGYLVDSIARWPIANPTHWMPLPGAPS